jgi:hypothetical protein
MTTPLPEFERSDFEQLLDEHQHLIALANDVEFCLHALAGGAGEEAIQSLQHSTGSLVRLLRQYLFRQDQQVLPVVDALSRRSRGEEES